MAVLLHTLVLNANSVFDLPSNVTFASTVDFVIDAKSHPKALIMYRFRCSMASWS